MGAFRLRRFMGGGATSGGVPSDALTIRPTEAIALDLSSSLADFSDEGNEVTIAVSSPTGVLSAVVWNQRTLTDGDSTGYVHRELLDNFHVRTSGATDGTEAGRITLTGYTGPNGTGEEIAKTLVFECSSAAPTTWAGGALTWVKFGGMPLHTYFPDAENLSVQSQSISGQLTVIHDNTNNRHRLVLAGTGVTAGNFPSSVSQFMSGATAPTPGSTNHVVLVNSETGASYNVAWTWVADQFDIAPWPATDTNNTQVGSQIAYWWRYYPKYYGMQVKLADEDFDPSRTMTYLEGYNGVATGIPIADTLGVGAPAGPFADGGWDYSANPAFDDGWITITSLSPQGADLGGIRFSYTSMGMSSESPVLGVRVTNVRWGGTGQLQPFYSRLGDSVADMIMVDHCYVSSNFQFLFGGTQNPLSHTGVFAIANTFRGNFSIYAKDIKVIGNRFECTRQAQDACNWLTYHSDPDNPKSEWAFNDDFNKQGMNNAQHEDHCQMQGNGGALSDQTGTVSMCDWYGNIIALGQGYIYQTEDLTTPDVASTYLTSNGLVGGTPLTDAVGTMAAGGQGYFSGDIPTTVYQANRYGANIVMEDSGVHGVSLTNVGTGWAACRNMILRDYNAEVYTGGGAGQFRFGKTTSAPGDDGGQVVLVKNLLTSATLYANPVSGGGTWTFTVPPADVGNVTGADASWQAARLNNHLIGAAAHDRGDYCRALDFQAGQEVDVGPFADKTIIDLRRHTVDKGRLYSAT